VSAVPSLYEGSCTALAESLHCGVPVVAFDMPFWKGLYDGAALLVPPRDPLALAGGIRRAIADRKLRGELVRKGRGPGRRYTMERTLCSYLRLYESLS
jgi:glycosyltransferase involved in cell wall biosynthesis